MSGQTSRMDISPPLSSNSGDKWDSKKDCPVSSGSPFLERAKRPTKAASLNAEVKVAR